MSKKLFERLSKYNSGKELGDRKSVHLTYHKQSTNRVVKRKVDPLGVKGSLLLAYDHKRKNIRSFKLERVKGMKKVASPSYIDGSREDMIKVLEHLQMQKRGSVNTSNFWAGFEKRAEMNPHLTHGLELAGLGILGYDEGRHFNSKDPDKRRASRFAAAGLGTLAVPAVYHFGSAALKKLRHT
jgi:hypothetical protein